MFITSTLRKVLHVQLDLAEKLCFTSACYRNGASAYGIFQEATESSVRFGSVRCFFGGSVRFGSVENLKQTTEFFVQKMARNRAFSAIFFQLFY